MGSRNVVPIASPSRGRHATARQAPPARQLERLVLKERLLRQDFRAARKRLAEVRTEIRALLERGVVLGPGVREARIELRKVLIVR